MSEKKDIISWIFAVKRRSDERYFFCVVINFNNCIIVDKVSYTVVDYIPYRKESRGKRWLALEYTDANPHAKEEFEDIRYNLEFTGSYRCNIQHTSYRELRNIAETFDAKLYKKIQKQMRENPTSDEQFPENKESSEIWETVKYRYENFVQKLTKKYEGRVITIEVPNHSKQYIAVSEFIVDYDKKWLPRLAISGDVFNISYKKDASQNGDKTEYTVSNFAFGFNDKHSLSGKVDITYLDDILLNYKKTHSLDLWNCLDNVDMIPDIIENEFNEAFRMFKKMRIFKKNEV